MEGKGQQGTDVDVSECVCVCLCVLRGRDDSPQVPRLSQAPLEGQVQVLAREL
jgi:hypothetical protein